MTASYLVIWSLRDRGWSWSMFRQTLHCWHKRLSHLSEANPQVHWLVHIFPARSGNGTHSRHFCSKQEQSRDCIYLVVCMFPLEARAEKCRATPYIDQKQTLLMYVFPGCVSFLEVLIGSSGFFWDLVFAKNVIDVLKLSPVSLSLKCHVT